MDIPIDVELIQLLSPLKTHAPPAYSHPEDEDWDTHGDKELLDETGGTG